MGRKAISISEAVFGRPKKRGWLRYVLRLVAFCSCFLLLVVIGLGIYVYYDREEIRRLFVEEVNRNLVTPVSVRDIRLEVWKEFPMLSVSFAGVSANGADVLDEEELFHAESISLRFNLRDIFQKKYIVREILVRGGDFNLKHYGEGSYNYVIWKRTDPAARPVSFHLRRVLLRNTLVRFRDLPAKHDFQLLARDVAAKGDLYTDGQDFHLRGEVDIHSMQAADFVFLSKRKGFLDIRFSNEKTGKKFNVRKGRVEIGDLAFATTGYVRYDKQSPYMDFSFRGKDLRAENLLALLPAASRAYMGDYTFKGRLSFDMGIKGDYTRAPLFVSAKFDYGKGQIRHKGSGMSVSDVLLRGAFSNGSRRSLESAALVLDTMYARLPTGSVSGRFTMRDFKTPYVRYEGSMQAELAQLQDFLKIFPDYRMQGMAQARLLFSHVFHAVEPKTWKSADFSNARVEGYLLVEDFKLDFPDRRCLQADSVHVDFAPRVAKTNLFTLKAGETELETRLFVENLLPYLLLERQNLYATVKLQARAIDWDKLSAWMFKADEAVKKKEAAGPDGFRKARNLPKDLYADVDVKLDKLYVRGIGLGHVEAMLRYGWETMTVEDLRFDALQGHFEGAVAMDRLTDGWHVDLQGRVRDMDIGSCFKAFDDFGQDQLTYRNIGGIFSSRFHASGKYLLPAGKMDLGGLRLWASLDIVDGVLQNLESLKRISRFTGEADLQDIRFARLQNVVEIKDACIHIPQMQVRSSVADLTFSGTHGFSNEVDYLVDIELSDLLSRRRAQRLKNEESFGVVTGGKSRIRLPLQVKGTWPDVEIRYVFSKARQGAKERLQENRHELREALDEEYSAMRERRAQRQERKALDKRRENGEFILELQDAGLAERPDSRTKDTTATKKKRKYKTEDDFRIEFEEE